MRKRKKDIQINSKKESTLKGKDLHQEKDRLLISMLQSNNDLDQERSYRGKRVLHHHQVNHHLILQVQSQNHLAQNKKSEIEINFLDRLN